MQYKLRTIVKSKTGYQYEIKGITIPPEISTFFENTWFNVVKSGATIILQSGAHQETTKEELNELDWETFKI